MTFRSWVVDQYVLDNNYQIIGPTYKIMYPDGTVEVKLPVVKLGEFNADYNEDINGPFVNDEDVIGRWEMIDHLPCKEMFHPEKRKSVITSDRVKELYFLPDGERYWCFGWTKGYLLSDCGYPHRKSRNPLTRTICVRLFHMKLFIGEKHSSLRAEESETAS